MVAVGDERAQSAGPENIEASGQYAMPSGVDTHTQMPSFNTYARHTPAMTFIHRPPFGRLFKGAHEQAR